MPTFKTHTQLKISQQEFDALKDIMERLERNELRYIKNTESNRRGFNMGTYKNRCGTVHCIAGWCDKLHATDFARSDQYNTPLGDLFFMNGFTEETLDNTTPVQAALAIRNYLMTGKPDWGNIIRE